MKLVTVAQASELEPNKAIMVEVEGEEIGLFRIDDEYFALLNTCPHREAYLHEGHIEGATVTCPWHFAVFDLRTGKPQSGPVECTLKTFKVVTDGNDIKLEISE